jgi:hypothetical protein
MARQFIIPPPTPALNSGPRYFFNEDPFDEPIATSYLGTPVYSNLIFLPDDVAVGNPTTVDPNNGKQQLRIDTVLFTIDMQKNIKKTTVQGRDGTVKEYISDGDYMINIKGAIVSPYPLVFPKDDVNLLIKYCKLKTQVPVVSAFLDLFEISDVVIDTYSFAEKLGSRNELGFELNCLSDRPIDFQLNPNRGL